MRPAPLLLLLVGAIFAGCAAPAVDAAERAEGAPLFSKTDVFPGDYEVGGPFSRVLAPGPFEALPPELVRMRSDLDGSPLWVALVRPALPDGALAPVILQASPYYHDVRFDSKDPEGTAEHLLAADALNHAYARALLENFVPHGYAVALAPVRGTGGTGGCWDTLAPAQRADLDQMVTWLGSAAWSNGRVGMLGLSQDGAAAWQAAATGNPHLRTIVPIAGFFDLHGLLFRNGTTSPASLAFAGATHAYGPTTNAPAPSDAEGAARLASNLACPDLAAGVAATAHAAATGERDPLGFWEARDLRPLLEENYRGSVLLVQGLADPAVFPSHAYPWIHRLEAAGVPVKHLLGSWSHTYPDWDIEDGFNANPTVRWDWAEILLRWFDRHLKGDASVDVGPRVQVADSAGAWRSEEAWPPADATLLRLRLTKDGALREGEAGPGGSLVVAAGAPGAACAGCATFRAEAQGAPLRFAGLPRVPLQVVPGGPGGHLTAHLLAEGPEGSRLLTSGQIDLRFAHGGDDARAVVPGAPLVARLELEPIDAVVAPGERLALVVAQGRHGSDLLFGRLPSVPTAPVVLEVGDGTKSAVELLTFERPPEAFFEPPGGSRALLAARP